MQKTKTFMTAALAAALIGAGAMPAASQMRGGPLAGPDPFEQETVAGDDWWQGRQDLWRRGVGGQATELESFDRGEYDRGRRMGREDERMGRERAAGGQFDRDRYMRDQMMRDRMESRATYGAARDYLDEARRQMDRGDLRAAWVALGRAETRLITRAGRGFGDEQAAAGGAVGAIRAARDALQNRNTDRAMNLADRAEALVQRGYIIGETVSGRRLSGAGYPGERQPFMGGNGSGSD
ncbi:hypothetical protein [Falsiroseomonas sp.]|uniref:hypothetical protein n=1 Tax=Falsiroseomonas sp. TaxID=2870721 RepID=UPI003561E452